MHPFEPPEKEASTVGNGFTFNSFASALITPHASVAAFSERYLEEEKNQHSTIGCT
jgi:hypothetical protein